MDECAGERQFLLHAAGEASGLALFERLDLFVDRLNEVIVFLDRRAEDCGIEVQILLHGEVLSRG